MKNLLERILGQKNIEILKPFLLLVFCLSAIGIPAAYAQRAKHVVLISIDGSRPEFYMDGSWHAPHLQALKEGGVYAAKGAQSVLPSITYPSHTTIVTGAYPATHGIYSNKPVGHRPGHAYWYAGEIRVETLWGAVRKAGLTSGSVYWPLTVGAPVDYLFPIRRPQGREIGLETQLSVTIPYVRPRSLLSDIERKTGHTFTGSSFDIKKDYRESKNIAKISNYIIKTYKPNLMAIHFVGTDHEQHAHGTDAPQVRDIVQITDSLVGVITQSIKDAGIWDSTAIIITGDHGHINNKAFFAPNVYLKKHGLIKENGWRAEFRGPSGSAFLYLRDKKGEATLDDQATVDSVVTIMQDAPEYKKGYFRIIDRKHLDTMGVNPNVALGLVMKAGIAFHNRSSGKTFKEAKKTQSSHGYDPTYPSMKTAFIAVGAGIGKHKNIEEIGLKDISVIIADLLDLDFDPPDGKLVPGILEN